MSFPLKSCPLTPMTEEEMRNQCALISSYLRSFEPGEEPTEADESSTKEEALERLAHVVRADETQGVIGMYEMAAWKMGATPGETEHILVYLSPRWNSHR